MFDSIHTFFHSQILNDCTNHEKKEKCIIFLKENIAQKYSLPFCDHCSFEDFLLFLEKESSNQKRILRDLMEGILFVMRCMQGVFVNVEYGVSDNALFTGDIIRTIVFNQSNTEYENLLYVYGLFKDSFFLEKGPLKCLR